MSKKLFLTAITLVLTCAPALAHPAIPAATNVQVQAPPARPITRLPIMRFAFIGCNRIGFTELSADNPSSANRAQLLRTFDDIANDRYSSSYLFMVGDLVTNYAEGKDVLEGQLEGWKALYETTALAKSSTVMVPLVGNHEVLTSVQNEETRVWTDFPNPATVPVWEQVMSPYLKWSDGPTTKAPNLDHLTQDQKRLSFTTRENDVLFISLNTDTFIDDTTVGDIPLEWLKSKLAEAENDSTIHHVFVIGHKPIERPDIPGSRIRDGEAEALDELLAGSPKVRALLTAHFHLWDCRKTAKGVLQVIAGNGGSPTSGNFNDDGKGYFGYTVVNLFDDGDLSIENWGRPIPVPYNADTEQPPATLREFRTFPGPENVTSSGS